MSKKLTQEEFETQIYEKYNGDFEVVGKYETCEIPIKIKHTKCGYEFYKKPNSINCKNSTCNCPNCSNNLGGLIIKGVNDLNTTSPYIASLLYNKDDGYKYSRCSSSYVDFVCPNCNKIIKKQVKNVSKYNILSCPFCSDGISYPNKFMANLLNKSGIEFMSEYKINKYYLDFVFTINNTRYAIEMDGGLGHGHKNIFGEKDMNGILTDEIKNNLCVKNNINLIRIDCNYVYMDKRYDYIKHNVIDSPLSELINMNCINFDEINALSCNSIICDISTSWNNGVDSYLDFSNIYHIGRPQIRRYLKQGCEIGLITESYEDVLNKIRLKSNDRIQSSKGERILCEQTNEIFPSIAAAKRKYHASNIHKYLKGIVSFAGTLPNGTKLTWKLL